MPAKVRIKAGLVEFEYEGDTEFALSDIKDLFSHIETLFKVPLLPEAAQPPASTAAFGNGAGPAPQPSKPAQKLHINSVATKLKAKSGSEVAYAAAAVLQIYEQKETFTRAQLLETMKKATMHYKESMSSNLSKALGTLVGSKFNQVSDGVYSLTSDAYHELEAQLA